MSPNNEDPRRDTNRPEDNPFIAFRRFADTQVSSLLNTVFTLPAHIANFNNKHYALEKCLFGRADKVKCDELQQLEAQMNTLRCEGRELYRVGDLQGVLNKGEQLMALDRQAEVIRKDIVENVRTKEENGEGVREQAQLVERVGNKKGQEWGWSWDWGFPKPFDAEDGSGEEQAPRRRGCRRWQHHMREDPNESDMERNRDHCPKSRYSYVRFGDNRERSTSHQASAPTRAKPEDDFDRQLSIFDELGDKIMEEVSRMMSESDPFPDFVYPGPYHVGALERDERLKRAGINWRDAHEDLMRAEQGAPLIPSEDLGKSRNMTFNDWTRRFGDTRVATPITRDPAFSWTDANEKQKFEYPKRVPWEDEEPPEEPSYEYAHDHEDQHDDPPTPKVKQDQWEQGMPETELDAYERLLGPTNAPNAPSEASKDGRPSILSTLTTTERTVAPDGTVTTKVVLKKRFADGKEESSETVHTQRGQEGEAPQDPWRAMQEAQARKQEKTKRSGWFWSS